MKFTFVLYLPVLSLIVTSAAEAESVVCPESGPIALSIEEVGPSVKKGNDLGLDEYSVDVPLKIKGHLLAEVRLSLFQAGQLVLDTYLRQYRYESSPDRVKVVALVANDLVPAAQITFDYQAPSPCPEKRRFVFKLGDIDVR